MRTKINFLRAIKSSGFILVTLFFSATINAQVIDPSLLQGLKYRNIGPHRAGRTVGVAGVASQPNVFYILRTKW